MTDKSNHSICAAIDYYREKEQRHSVVLDALDLDIGDRRDGISER
jgi:peptidyl-tRNA hydrolase